MGSGPLATTAAPDNLLTITAYSKIGELCGAQPALERLGAHVVSTWLSATVADHKENVTVANLRESLKECEIPASRHDSWIATISKYLGDTPNTPLVVRRGVPDPTTLCGMRAQLEIGLAEVIFAPFFCGRRERCSFPTAP